MACSHLAKSFNVYKVVMQFCGAKHLQKSSLLLAGSYLLSGVACTGWLHGDPGCNGSCMAGKSALHKVCVKATLNLHYTRCVGKQPLTCSVMMNMVFDAAASVNAAAMSPGPQSQEPYATQMSYTTL